ncbi:MULTISPECIES: hypothetical protein [unclassified Curtobacterium]|uniref:hypothetical protein n=1 Tax=unclassified Curtobacterium TaxID=257496 RepID=UPI0039B02E75
MAFVEIAVRSSKDGYRWIALDDDGNALVDAGAASFQDAAESCAHWWFSVDEDGPPPTIIGSRVGRSASRRDQERFRDAVDMNLIQLRIDTDRR